MKFLPLLDYVDSNPNMQHSLALFLIKLSIVTFVDSFLHHSLKNQEATLWVRSIPGNITQLNKPWRGTTSSQFLLPCFFLLALQRQWRWQQVLPAVEQVYKEASFKYCFKTFGYLDPPCLQIHSTSLSKLWSFSAFGHRAYSPLLCTVWTSCWNELTLTIQWLSFIWGNDSFRWLSRRLGGETRIWQMLLWHRGTNDLEWGQWEVRGTWPRQQGHTHLRPITGGKQLHLILDWPWSFDWGYWQGWGGSLEVGEFKHHTE